MGRRHNSFLCKSEVFVELSSYSVFFCLCFVFPHYRTISIDFDCNLGLVWYCVAPHCDWSRKLAPLSQPIRCKTKTNQELVARVFSRVRKFRCFSFEFSLAFKSISFLLIGRFDYFGFGFGTLIRKALNRLRLISYRALISET